MKLKPSTRDLNSGFTLVELLVSTLVAGAVLSVSLGLINEQRRQVLADQTRTQGTQNLRAAVDLIGADIKLAGERLDGVDFMPVIALQDGNGTDGSPNEHDRLVLQRKLISDNLEVCEEVSGSDSTIVVARKANIPTQENCSFSDDGNGNAVGNSRDALTDALNAFKDYRCSFGATDNCDQSRATAPSSARDCDDECVIAVIVDPTTGLNELFYYTSEQCEENRAGDCNLQIAGDPTQLIQNTINAIPLEGNNWVNTYTPGSLIYIFEEREYSFDDDEGTLELVTNRQDDWVDSGAAFNNGQPVPLVNQIRNFDVQVGVSTDPNPNDNIPPTNPLQNSINTARNGMAPFFADWQTVHRLRVLVEAESSSDSDLIQLPRGGCELQPAANRLCLASEFFPRNSISTDSQ